MWTQTLLNGWNERVTPLRKQREQVEREVQAARAFAEKAPAPPPTPKGQVEGPPARHRSPAELLKPVGQLKPAVRLQPAPARQERGLAATPKGE